MFGIVLTCVRLRPHQKMRMKPHERRTCEPQKNVTSEVGITEPTQKVGFPRVAHQKHIMSFVRPVVMVQPQKSLRS